MDTNTKLSAGLPHPQLLASAIGLAVAAQAGFVVAAEAKDKTGSVQLGDIEVQDSAVEDEGYQATKAASPKYTEPLRDTPQTITVIPKKVIEDQNLLTMRDILSTVPGITFGAGEGGGGFGDSINLRGFSASNDIYVDGVRDSAQYSRTDPFNLEQVEVVNGASSVYSGAGAAGGTINLVTKSAQAANFTKLSGGLGTDNYQRLTVDTNQQINDSAAFRLNLMAHRNDVPGRDEENFERWGIAPSLTFGLGTPTQVTVNYEHQDDKNMPQYGVPVVNGHILGEADWDDYYGYSNINTQEITTDALSLKLEHEFNDNVSIRNFSRIAQVQQLTRTSGPEGTYCLSATGRQPSGAACPAGLLPGFYQPGGGSQGAARDTTNTIYTNQTDLTTRFSTGFIDHTLVTGMAFTREEYDAHTGNWMRTENGNTVPLPPNSISNPNHHWAGESNFYTTAKVDGEMQNRAFYAFDTLKFNEQWELNGGLRYERNEGSSASDAVAAVTGAVTPGARSHNSDDLLSYRLGLVYKPAENGSIYVAYGNSETPSQASVNGSCASTRSGVTTDNCNVDPEESRNYEIGTKWDLLDERLSLTAALFRNDRTNYKVADLNPGATVVEQTLDGKARVDGIALGASGLITDQWQVFANYTYLDSEVLQGASDAVSAATGDPTKGNPLPVTPKHAMSLWTTYDLPHNFQVGYGLTTQSKQYLTSNDNAPTGSGYTIHRAMLAYKVDRNLNLRLNVNNLFDKQYLTRYRTTTSMTNTSVVWATPGDGRSAVLTADYSF